MGSSLAGQQIKNTYKDVLQLSNSGGGFTGPLSICDGTGLATGVKLSANGPIIANSSPSGYLGYETDGVTVANLLTIKGGNNNVVIDYSAVSQAFVQVGASGTGNGPGLFLAQHGRLWGESSSGTFYGQDLTMAWYDNSNNLQIGVRAADGAGQNDAADMFFNVPGTTQTYHWTANGADQMTLTYQGDLLVFGGYSGNGLTVHYASGAVQAQGAIASRLYVACGGNNAPSGINSVVAGVTQPVINGVGGGWFQNTAGTSRMGTSGNVTNATTTLSSGVCSDLSLTLIAGRMYIGKIVLFLNNSTAAEGFKLDLNGGGGTATSVEFGIVAAQGATFGIRTATSLSGVVNLSALLDTSDVVVEIAITIVCANAGTLVPRVAENSHSSGTLTVKTGSYFLLDDSPN